MGKILKFKPRQKPTQQPKIDPEVAMKAVVIDIASQLKNIFTQNEIDQIKKELSDEGETRTD